MTKRNGARIRRLAGGTWLAVAAVWAAGGCLPEDWPPPAKQAAKTPQPMQVVGVAKITTPLPSKPPTQVAGPLTFPLHPRYKPLSYPDTFQVLEARFARANELTVQEDGGLVLYLLFSRQLQDPRALLNSMTVDVSTIHEGLEIKARGVEMIGTRAIPLPYGTAYLCRSKQPLLMLTKRVDGHEITCDLAIAFTLASDRQELLDGDRDGTPGGNFRTWFRERGDKLHRPGGTIQGDSWTGWLKSK